METVSYTHLDVYKRQIKLNRHILGKGTLTGAYLEAADANRKGDGGNALDMIIMNRHILGKSKISQN